MPRKTTKSKPATPAPQTPQKASKKATPPDTIAPTNRKRREYDAKKPKKLQKAFGSRKSSGVEEFFYLMCVHPGLLLFVTAFTTVLSTFESGGWYKVGMLYSNPSRAPPDPSVLLRRTGKKCRCKGCTHHERGTCEQVQRPGIPFCSGCGVANGYGCEVCGHTGIQTSTSFNKSVCNYCMHFVLGLHTRQDVREKSSGLLANRPVSQRAVPLHGELNLEAGTMEARFDTARGKTAVSHRTKILDTEGMRMHDIGAIRGAKDLYTKLVKEALASKDMPKDYKADETICIKVTHLNKKVTKVEVVGCVPKHEEWDLTVEDLMEVAMDGYNKVGEKEETSTLPSFDDGAKDVAQSFDAEEGRHEADKDFLAAPQNQDWSNFPMDDEPLSFLDGEEDPLPDLGCEF